jgi:hypothetical protein
MKIFCFEYVTGLLGLLLEKMKMMFLPLKHHCNNTLGNTKLEAEITVLFSLHTDCNVILLLSRAVLASLLCLKHRNPSKKYRRRVILNQQYFSQKHKTVYNIRTQKVKKKAAIL